MNERDARLLFDAGHWAEAKVVREHSLDGWHVLLIATNPTNPTHILSSKRGRDRNFKTSDAAIQWCKDIGFTDITIQFSTLSSSDELPVNRNATVLLVEDNVDDIQLTERAFENCQLNIDFQVCRDGEIALNYIFHKAEFENTPEYNLPKLILLDINLPKINGLQVLKKIRENDKTRCIPVVLLTTSDEFCDIHEGYQLGSNSYIKKPLDFKVFNEVIKDIAQYWLRYNTPPPLNSN